MKTFIVRTLGFLVTIGIASAASAGENWIADQDGDSYLMMASKDASIRHTIGRISIGFRCTDGDANPMSIMLIGEGMRGDGQVTYVMKVDDGPMMEPFEALGEYKAILEGNSETRAMIDRLKRGNKLLIGARDESNEVSVFELSLAGFTSAFNGSIPARCLK